MRTRNHNCDKVSCLIATFLSINLPCTNDSLCFRAETRKSDDRDVTVTGSSQVAAAAARQTDEDVTLRETLFLVSLGQMIYHFLAHVIDITRSNLTDELAAKDILSPYEGQRIKELKKIDAKKNSLLIMLKEKSAAQFERFLTTLSETGQQSVADVVLQALRTVRQTGHNPLHYAYGMPAQYNLYLVVMKPMM